MRFLERTCLFNLISVHLNFITYTLRTISDNESELIDEKIQTNAPSEGRNSPSETSAISWRILTGFIKYPTSFSTFSFMSSLAISIYFPNSAVID